MMPDSEIREIVMPQDDGRSICGELVSGANTAGGYDNITVIAYII